MNPFKKFLNKKKINHHFKGSGQGVRLNSGEGSSAPSIVSGGAQGGQVDRVALADVAAQAAIKRVLAKEQPSAEEASRRRIQMIAKRELEEEKRREDPEAAMRNLSINDRNEPDFRELEHSSAISGIYFTCELLGEDIVRRKADLMKELEEFLLEQCQQEEDAIVASVFMVYTLNKTKQKETAIETIGKYVQNILEHPGEEKYRKIRVSNKAFQERVAATLGGKQFLEAVGFAEIAEDDGERYLVYVGDNDAQLAESLDTLRNGQPVPMKVARCLQIFSIKEGQKIASPQLSKDFFNLTAEEVKGEQRVKTEQVERMLTLRTKEMRSKDEQLRNYRYKYTLIRVRLPGNFLVQGVFGCLEPLSAVRIFIASALSDVAAISSFSLRDAFGQQVEDESPSLAELGLAPAAVLHLVFAYEPEGDILSEESTKLIQPMA